MSTESTDAINNLWRVEVGRGKGAYKVKYSFGANEAGRALTYFNSIHVHSGHKKRLVAPGGKVHLRELT